MTTSRPGIRRRSRFVPALLAGCLLVTSCTTEITGKGTADDTEAAEYVSEKFGDKLQNLSGSLHGEQPQKVRLQWQGRVDDSDSGATVHTVKVGSPPSYDITEQSIKDSDDTLETYHPAGSKVQYVRLGPRYESLAPTPWVSMPYEAWGSPQCAMKGYRMFCKMVNSIADATEKHDAAKKATTRSDGATELVAGVTLRDILANEIIAFPDDLLEVISDSMKNEQVRATVRLDPDGDPASVAMNGTVSGGEHEVEIHVKFEVLGSAAKDDMPGKPAKDDLTKLKDQDDVDDFYERMGDL